MIKQEPVGEGGEKKFYKKREGKAGRKEKRRKR